MRCAFHYRNATSESMPCMFICAFVSVLRVSCCDVIELCVFLCLSLCVSGDYLHGMYIRLSTWYVYQ